MLTRDFCKNYIKNSLGVPNVPFELKDEDLDYWLDYTITIFSSYIPAKTFVKLTDSDKIEKNTYVIPYDGNIISVLAVYPGFGYYIAQGHPYRFIQSREEASIFDWEIRGEAYSIVKSQSSINFTFEFKPPKYLLITPSVSSTYTVELAVEHSPDLSTVKQEYIEIFLKLYFIHVGTVLLNIRSMYRTISTPFGDIEINTDNLSNLIDRYRDEIKEYFDTLPPLVYIVRG